MNQKQNPLEALHHFFTNHGEERLWADGELVMVVDLSLWNEASAALEELQATSTTRPDPTPIRSCKNCKHDNSCVESGRHRECIIGNELLLFELSLHNQNPYNQSKK